MIHVPRGATKKISLYSSAVKGNMLPPWMNPIKLGRFPPMIPMISTKASKASIMENNLQKDAIFLYRARSLEPSGFQPCFGQFGELDFFGTG